MLRPQTPICTKQVEASHETISALKIRIAPEPDPVPLNFSKLAAVKTTQKLTAVIITHNVAGTIGDCLAAIQEVAGEILVLDSFSDDGTVEICRQYGATLVPQEWLGYSATKNLGNSLARHDWILSIDADEVLSDELVNSLKNLTPEDGVVYALDRLTNYCGKWIRHSGWYPDWKVRLFNRNDVQWQGEFVHETLAIPAGFDPAWAIGDGVPLVSDFPSGCALFPGIPNLAVPAARRALAALAAGEAAESLAASYVRQPDAKLPHGADKLMS